MRVLTFLTLPALVTAGCTTSTCVNDLQAVFGPARVAFDRRTFAFDFNCDGRPERVVLFADMRRGLKLPSDVSQLSDIGGVIVDGFAVFDGVRPNVPVFYQYNEYGGYGLRLDNIDGQHLLVSDGDRDHVQHVWGWWRYAETWPPDGWEARERVWNQQRKEFGVWRHAEKIAIVVGK